MSNIDSSSSFFERFISKNVVDLEERRKRRVYLFFLMLTIPTFFAFGIIYLVLGKFQLAIPDLLVVGFLVLSFFVIRKLKKGLPIFRIITLVYSITVVYWAYLGSANGFTLIWVLCFPLIAFSFLEKNEGLIWTMMVYSCCFLIFVLPQELLSSYSYTFAFKLRFSGVYILISFFTYQYEAIRIDFWRNFQEKQANLEKEIHERKAAEKALLAAQENLESQIEARTRELTNANHALQHEVEERITIEEQLRTSQDRFRDLAELLPQTVYELDLQGYLTYSNQFGYKHTGYTQEDLESRFHVTDLFVGEDKEKIARNIALIVNNETPPDNEFTMKKKNGETFPALIYSRRVIKEGKTVGLRGVMIDISKRKLFEEELMKAKEAAEQANIAKNTFLANMSHELRTPLNGVLGITELLQLTELDEQQQKYLKTISQSGSVLLKILNDILDLSRIEMNKFDIEPVKFNLSNTIENIVHLFAGSIEIKGLKFNYHIDDSIPESLIGDPVRLGQILSNVLSNAQKFTEKGQITLEVVLKSQSDTGVVLLFSVQDTGIGIAGENLPLIFESFTQVDSSTTRKYGGAGLGLTITKNIVELMNGRIRIISQEKKGTRIQIELPFGISTTASAEESKLPGKEDGTILKAEHFRILVVDDDRLSRIVCREMLDKMGYQVDLVSSGKEALAKLEQSPYSAVLMDCLMPDMDGFETTRRIREKNFKDNFTCHLPIIALTAKAMKKDKERCLAAGMNDFVTKPVSFTKLQETLEANLSGPVQSSFEPAISTRET